MTSKIEELLKNQHWMIHDLRDTDQILNDEEEELQELSISARLQYQKIKIWLIKTYEWFDSNDNLNVNSFAYKELEEIIKEIE